MHVADDDEPFHAVPFRLDGIRGVGGGRAKRQQKQCRAEAACQESELAQHGLTPAIL
jgi:hypothetical protein